MNDILNNLIKNCEWQNNIMGVPVCSAEIAPCTKIIESGKCPILIKHFKEREKLIKDLQENQDILPMGHYEPQEKQCADCNHYGKLSLDCGRCNDDCSMYEPQESEEV